MSLSEQQVSEVVVVSLSEQQVAAGPRSGLLAAPSRLCKVLPPSRAHQGDSPGARERMGEIHLGHELHIHILLINSIYTYMKDYDVLS